jgi:hypothetical protein
MFAIPSFFGFQKAGFGPTYDADAQAFFDRVTTAGGSLTTTEKNATNQLVLDMKSAGIWSAMRAVYPMIGASAAACAQNLKSSSFTGTFNGGITYASTGITGNGTTGFMNTGLAPSANLSQNSTHLSYYSRTSGGSLETEMGTTNGATNRLQITFSYSAICYNAVNNGVTQFASTITTGFMIANRIISTQIKTFRNGTILNTSTSNSTGLHSGNIAILAVNDSSGVIQYSTKQCAFASIGDGLTDTQASNFYTAVQAFQTTLSRQI